MNNGDAPAMPLTGDAYSDISDSPMTNGKYEQGMGLTKREHFAGLAMQALINIDARFEGSPNVKAELAVKMADALLEELSNV